MRFDGHNMAAFMDFFRGHLRIEEIDIEDYVLKIEGKFHICPPALFAAIYEPM